MPQWTKGEIDQTYERIKKRNKEYREKMFALRLLEEEKRELSLDVLLLECQATIAQTDAILEEIENRHVGRQMPVMLSPHLLAQRPELTMKIRDILREPSIQALLSKKRK